MRLFFFLIIIAGVVNKNAFAQKAAFPQLKLQLFDKQYANQAITRSASFVKMDSVVAQPLQNRLPFNFYSQHLGVACKMELQLEKQTRLPIRLRLGSKEQVDYLEGKFDKRQ